MNGEEAEARALLESEELVLRGDVRLKIPFREASDVRAEDGVLRLAWPGGSVELDLGDRAPRWAERIRNPRTLADKLGLKPELATGVVNLEHELLAGLGPPRKGSDLIFLGADSQADLEQTPRLAALLAPAGGLWIVAPKGRQDVTENDVLAAGRAAGLTDVKVAKFSETHTAHKFVIPRARRGT